MAKASKRAKKKDSKPSLPTKKDEKKTAKPRVTALGRHMESVKVKK